MTKHKSHSNYQRAQEEVPASSFLQQLETLTEAELQNIYDIMSLDMESLTKKEKMDLFWITDKLVDLSDEARKQLWYDILEVDESDIYED